MNRDLRFGDRALISAAGALLTTVIRCLAWSCRMEIRGLERLEGALDSGRGVIMGVWHGDIVSLFCFRHIVQLPPLVTMVSRSKDGDAAAAIARSVAEITCVRASSSRGGARGVLEFRKLLTEDRKDGFRPMGVHLMDGPRGPRHKAKGGIIALARTTNALVVPLVFGMSRRHIFRSWDRHRVPMPFARCVLTVGDPVDFMSGAAADSDQQGMNDEERLAEFERGIESLAREEVLAARDYD